MFRPSRISLSAAIKKIVCVLPLLMAGLAGQAFAQQIGSVQLRLGESRDEVVSKLSQHYRVTDGGIVMSRTGPPYEVAGAVTFAAGRLTSVSRSWSPNATDSRLVTRALVRALTQLEGQGPCFVIPERLVYPEFESEGVEVRCGQHTISISGGGTYRGQPVQVGISELWQSEKGN